jgi:hypothetical protein
VGQRRHIHLSLPISGKGGCDFPVVLKSTAVGIPANKGG